MFIYRRKISLIIFSYLLLLSNASAIEEAGSAIADSYSWEVIKVVFSLMLVLIIFYLLANVFKKYMGMTFNSTSSMRVLGGLSLGGKEKVVLIEAGKVSLLLGVSSAGVNKIHQFTEDELINYQSENEQEAISLSSSFKSQIEKILKNNS